MQAAFYLFLDTASIGASFKFQTHGLECLVAISTWIACRYLQHYMPQNEWFPVSPPNLLLHPYPSHSKAIPSFQQLRSKPLESASSPHCVSHRHHTPTKLVGFTFKVYLRSEHFSPSALLPLWSELPKTQDSGQDDILKL